MALYWPHQTRHRKNQPPPLTGSKTFFNVSIHLKWAYGDRPVTWAWATTAKLGNDWMVRSTQSDWFVTPSLSRCWPDFGEFLMLVPFSLLSSLTTSSSIPPGFPLSSTSCMAHSSQSSTVDPLSPRLPSFYRTPLPSILLSMLSSPDNHLNCTLLWQPLLPSLCSLGKVELFPTLTHMQRNRRMHEHPVFVIRVAHRVPRQQDILRLCVWEMLVDKEKVK